MSQLSEKFKAWRERATPMQRRESREAPVSLARVGWMGYPNSQAPFGEATKRQPVRWVERADVVALPVPKARRTKRASPLTRIAEQLPRKLKRIEPPA